MHKLGVEEWLVSAVMFMYIGAKTVVRTVYGNSNGFEVCVDLLLLQMLPIATSRFQRAWCSLQQPTIPTLTSIFMLSFSVF